jgi:release factor glutamine methyltransferase
MEYAPQTIQLLLMQASRQLDEVSDSPALDAEVLLCFVLNKTRSYLRAWCDALLTAQQVTQFEELLARRKDGVPIAYLTGQREFWSREFYVTPDVLIPRPDTELLIELSLRVLAEQPNSQVIDLGTGSGVIAVTLAAECPRARVYASDSSAAALLVAQKNAAQHEVKVTFYLSDWFSAVPSAHFTLIVSNPPYIAEEDVHLQHGDVRFEPRQALVAARQGLADIAQIAAAARDYLQVFGWLLIEHGYDQAVAVQRIFTDLGYTQVQTHDDLSGHARVTQGQWRVGRED